MSYVRVFAGLVMLGGMLAIPRMTAAQNFPDIARRLGPREDGGPIPIPASPAEYWPTTLDDVARKAVVVLQARLSRSRSYLSPSEDRILTDYAIVAPQVIAGYLTALPTQTPGTTAPLTLSVWGGEAVVEGVLMSSLDGNFEPIKDGAEYLLFLRPGRVSGPGRYEVYYGAIFEVSQDTIRPLLKNAKDIFRGTADARLEVLVGRIQKAVQVR